MKCPFCSSLQDKVLESRTLSEGEVIRRRRECMDCKKRFTSYERLEERPLLVIKRNGSKEFYNQDKILKGVVKAAEKRNISPVTLEQLVDEVTEELYKRPEREVGTEEIGEMIMKRLARLDHVAYVRFASVYKQFNDVGDFIAEIKKM